MRYFFAALLICTILAGAAAAGLAQSVPLTVLDSSRYPISYDYDVPTEISPISFCGSAGVSWAITCSGVLDVDLRRWADPKPGSIHINIVDPGKKAVLVSNDLSSGVSAGSIHLNNMLIEWPSGTTADSLAKIINDRWCSINYSGNIAVSDGSRVNLTATSPGSFLYFMVLQDNMQIFPNGRSFSMMGEDAIARMTDESGADITDATWSSASDYIFVDTMGNQIKLTPEAASSVGDKGAQIRVDILPASKVEWANSATNERVVCNGSTTWDSGNIRLSHGGNPITVTAYDNSGNSSSRTFKVNWAPNWGSLITSPTSDDVYSTADSTIDISGVAGLFATPVGMAVSSADLRNWPNLPETYVFINVTQVATKAMLTASDAYTDRNSPITPTTNKININGVDIDYSGATTIGHVIDKINAVSAETSVTAQVWAMGLDFATTKVGTAPGIHITNGRDLLRGGIDTATAVGVDAYAIVYSPDGNPITDPLWTSGNGCVIADSLGNSITLTETAATTVGDFGLQLDVQSAQPTRIAWRNELTGEGGTCAANRCWNTNGVRLLPGVNKITVTADFSDGTWGEDTLWVINPDIRSAGWIKRLPDGVKVTLKEQVVSAGSSELGDCFYVQSKDRSSGIKVKGAATERGQVVDIEGVVSISDYEMSIQANSVIPTGSEPDLRPLGMKISSLGGMDYGRQIAVEDLHQHTSSDGTKYLSIDCSSGSNNIGLLVRTCGNVIKSDANSVTLADGSGQMVRCILPTGISPDQNWHYLSATGISSLECMYVDGVNCQVINRVLRVRCRDDIQAIK